MPRRIGIELTAQVKNDVPTLRILIVTAQTEQ
jgi:DNA-binding NarL/FixJ family response regulator